MAKRRPTLRVVFGRLVFAAVPLLGTTGCSSPPPTSCDRACIVTFPKGTTVVVVDGGLPDGGECLDYCPAGFAWNSCEPEADGSAVRCDCPRCLTIGRAPAGLRPAEAIGPTPLARFLAKSAHLESAAVVAFRGLATELQKHDAPRGLLQSLEAAAQDEVRHARTMGRLAQRHGAQPPPVEVDSPDDRSLEAIASENAVDGCVFETHAALLATWQAQAATDPAIRRAMRTIAADETRHAEVSWALARWLNGRLTPAERSRVARARTEALAQLVHVAGHEEEAGLIDRAGLPPCAAAMLLAIGLAREIGERAAAFEA